MTARIYRPAPNAMQSGKGKSKGWVLVHEPASQREIEPLMGYTSTTDTQIQVRLSFETLEEAETYARANGIPARLQDYEIVGSTFSLFSRLIFIKRK